MNALTGSTDVAAALVTVMAESRAGQLETAMLKQQARQDQALADMVSAAAERASTPPAPPGQGRNFDRYA